jgi:hypothetical protein
VAFPALSRKIAHGNTNWYHPNRSLKSTGTYVNGKKQGTWLAYHLNGIIRDSSTYLEGRLRGIHYQWHDDGSIADSTQFDENGNGVQVSWYKDGTVSAAGYWTQDTLKRGRWQYFHSNGQLKATEDYQAGKLVTNACYDSTGKQMANCEEKEATFPGGVEGWRRFLERNLDAGVPVRKGAPVGQYMVVVQFIVDKDGSINDVKALSNLGYGMEEEVVRLVKKGPQWIPAVQFGQPVKAYRKQPITFVVSQSSIR